jgi:hypothetical protein
MPNTVVHNPALKGNPTTTTFYSYLWLRSKAGFAPAGTPYYAGKGSGNRACSAQHNVRPPKDRSRIVIFPMLNEAEAFESEMALIELFGRQDNGTGILRNRTDGGDGPSGYKFTEDQLRRVTEKNRKQAADSKWQQAQAEGMARAEMFASPKYQKNVAEANRKKAADPEWQEANRKGSHNRYHVKGWFSEKTGKHFPPKPSVRCPLCSEQGLVVAWG